MTDEELLEQYFAQQYEEEKLYATLLPGVTYRTFTSTSKGAGRKRRNPETVELISFGGFGGKYYQPHTLPEAYVIEALEGIGKQVDQGKEVEFFLNEVRRSNGY